MTTQEQTVVLETAARDFSDATSKPPFIYELSPDKARAVLEDVQRSPTTSPTLRSKTSRSREGRTVRSPSA
jgi:hypothetical protein